MLASPGWAANPGDIVINEFLASNNSDISDENGDFDDWVELHNTTDAPIDIAGMWLTDEIADPASHQIPAGSPELTTIPAGGYLVLWFDGEPTQGVLHVNEKLSGNGEEIGLFDTDGTTAIDTHVYGQQITDISEGRESDGAANFVFFSSPSPGAENIYEGTAGNVASPEFDQPSGEVAGPVDVSISTETPGATIYYTTDGTAPDESSTLYTGPISVTSPTPIRARAYRDGFDPSEIVTRTFLVGVSHSFAIIAVTADEDLFYDPVIGILPNYEQDIEIVANVELYEPDNTLAFSQLSEVEVHGNASAAEPQKSLRFEAKASLGNEFFNYRIFPELEIDRHLAFVGRNSGQENRTMFKDAYLSSLVHNTSDVDDIVAPDIDTQAYRPAVTYINGVYYGIHNIREHMKWRWIVVNAGVNRDDIDLIEFQAAAEGNTDAYYEMLYYMRDNDLDLSDDAKYDVIRGWIDIDSYIDYMATEIYIDNRDWPGNNNRTWRERKDGELWRWLLWDLDIAAYSDASKDNLERILDVSIAGTANNSLWATEIFRALWTNARFRTAFANRMADKINVLFNPVRTDARLNDFIAAYTPEMPAHVDLWEGGNNRMVEAAGNMSTFFNNRAPLVQQHVQTHTPEVTGTTDVTLNVNPVEGGSIQFNTIIPPADSLPWVGTFFTGTDIPMLATPNKGYVFDNWSGVAALQEPASAVNLSSSTFITANFTVGSHALDPIVINEINAKSADCPDTGDWLELHNPTANAVDVSGWYVEDSSGYFIIPGNTTMQPGDYLVVAEDLTAFSLAYPSVTNVVGSFGDGPTSFGLKGGGELVQLYNAAGAVIDSVDYDNSAPWPSPADDESFQLNDPLVDNDDGTAWTSAAPSPGGVNDAPIAPVTSHCDGSGSSSSGGSTSSTGGTTSSTGGTTSSTGGTTSSTGGTTSSTGGTTSSTGGTTSSTGGTTSSTGGTTSSTGGTTSSTGGSTSSSGGSSTNTAPVVEYPGTMDTLCNVPVSLQMNATDADGDSLTWVANNLHPGLEIDNNGLISGVIESPGGKKIDVYVNDGTVDSNVIRFWWAAYTCGSGGGSTSSTGGTTSSTGGTTSSTGGTTSSTGGTTSSTGGTTSSTGGTTSSTGGTTSSSGGTTSSTGSSSGGGTNTQPVVQYPGGQDSICGTPVELQLTATDADGDTLTWFAENLHPGLEIDQNGLISGVISQAGGKKVTVWVNDGTVNSGEIRFWWSAYTCDFSGGSSSSTSSTGGTTSSTGGTTSSTGGTTSSTGGTTSSTGGTTSSTGGTTSSTGGTTSSTGGTTSSTGGTSSSSGGGSNTAPVVEYPGTMDTLCNVPVSLQMNATDADGDSLTWVANNLHPGLEIDNNGLISGVIESPGGKKIDVYVNDGTVDSNVIRFWWAAYSCQ